MAFNTLIIGLLILAIIFAIIGVVKRMKNKSGCCGSGSVIIEPTVKLDNVVATKTLHIEGMHCENCINSVTRRLQNIEGVSCKVNLKKNLALVEMDHQVDDSELIAAVESGGFKVISMD